MLKDYAHFTKPPSAVTPIWAIHRIMTDMLKGTEKETMIRYTDFACASASPASVRSSPCRSSGRPRTATRPSMPAAIWGECYEGTISGVTQRGLFIESTTAEGFVPASSLTSGTSSTEGVRLTDPASGKTWSLGDKMMITIVRADVNPGKIDPSRWLRRQSLRRGGVRASVMHCPLTWTHRLTSKLRPIRPLRRVLAEHRRAWPSTRTASGCRMRAAR